MQLRDFNVESSNILRIANSKMSIFPRVSSERLQRPQLAGKELDVPTTSFDAFDSLNLLRWSGGWIWGLKQHHDSLIVEGDR